MTFLKKIWTDNFEDRKIKLPRITKNINEGEYENKLFSERWFILLILNVNAKSILWNLTLLDFTLDGWSREPGLRKTVIGWKR